MSVEGVPEQSPHDACRALVALAHVLATTSPPSSPRRFLCALAKGAAGIRTGPLALFDLLRGGDNPLSGTGFRCTFNDATRGQVRHFVGTARAVTLIGTRGTEWISVHVRRDAPDSADGRLGAAAIEFAVLLLRGTLAVPDASEWIRMTLCVDGVDNARA